MRRKKLLSIILLCSMLASQPMAEVSATESVEAGSVYADMETETPQEHGAGIEAPQELETETEETEETAEPSEPLPAEEKQAVETEETKETETEEAEPETETVSDNSVSVEEVMESMPADESAELTEPEAEASNDVQESEKDTQSEMAAEEDTPTSGTCGDNLTWTLENGTLTISGTGAMYNYEYDEEYENYPWKESVEKIKKIIIQDGVSRIGNDVFEDFKNLTNISIPDSVTSIGRAAFSGCSSLAEITIPDNVTSIGEWTFSECSSLTEIAIPDSITGIGEGAFSYCDNLNEVYISSIENWCNIDFHASGTQYTYWGNPLCNGANLYINGDLVKDLIIPDSVTNISDGAFCGCKSLTNITISDSVTIIGVEAFKNCKNLTNVTIPNSINCIYVDAFDDCNSLTGVYISSIESWCNIEFGNSLSNPLCNGANLYINGNLVKDLIIPDSVTSIGNYAFYHYSNLTNITIPTSVVSIGKETFAGCSNLTGVYISSIESWCNIEFDDDLSNPLCNGANLYVNGNLVKDLIIPDSVTNIGDYVFNGCSNLTNITLPASVTSIGNRAFYDCNSLTNITMSASVTSIGNYAFCDCNSLTNITLPTRVASIGYDAFAFCSSLTNITIPDSVANIGSSAFAFCSSLTNIAIPNGVTSIYRCTFQNCNSLAEIIIPKSVTYIEYNAFYNASSLSNIYYGGSESDWQNIAIIGISDDGNKALNTAHIYYNMGDTLGWNIDIDGVLSIYGMSKMADYNDSNFPAPWSGYRDEIKKVIISQFVASIGSSAFTNCKNLTTITIPYAVESIGDSAFSGCDNLEKVDFIGNEKQWNIIAIGADNAPLQKAKISCRYPNIESDGNKTNMFIQKKKVPYYDTIHGVNQTLDIDWGWSLMTSSGYNNKAAIAGLVLSGATESSQENAEQAMKDLGFSSKSPKSKFYNKEWYEIAQPAVTFGYKHVIYKNDIDGHFFAVAVRGTTDAADWLTNGTSLVGSFSMGADFVCTELESYMIECTGMPLEDLKRKGNVQFFVTGHSLGGAVANITAKNLIEKYSAASVVAYTFAAPPCATITDVLFTEGNYDIYNIINDEDMVPKLTWVINGLVKRNGKDMPFHRDDDPDIYTKFNTLTGGKDLKELMTGWEFWDPIWTNASRIPTKKLCAHSPSVYMAYISNSVTSTHRGKRIAVHCPVDVEVYAADGDENFLVCRITDNKIDDTIPAGTYAYVDGDDKYIELLYEGDYTIKLTATDSGTMTYAVQSFDNGTNQVVDEKIYSNVVLAKNKKMTSSISVWDKTDSSIDTADKVDMEDVQLLVLDNKGEPEKEVLPDGNGTEVPFKNNKDHGDVSAGDIPSDGNIPEGIWTAGIQSVPYTGTAIKQSFRIYNHTLLLVEGRDYTVTYKNNTRAYEYTDSDFATYQSRKSAVPPHTDDGHYYDGFDAKRAPQAIVKMKGNYTGKQILYFTITRPEIGTLNVPDLYAQYNKKKQTPVPNLTWNGKQLKADRDFYVKEYVEAKKDKNAFQGTETGDTVYPLTLVGKGNFTGTRQITLTILGKTTDNSNRVFMGNVKASAIPAQTYQEGRSYTLSNLTDKNGNSFSAVFKYDSYVLKEGTDYEVSAIANNDKIGTASVTLRGLNQETSGTAYRFVGDKIITFQIVDAASGKQKHTLTEADVIINQGGQISAIYMKGGAKPQLAVTYAGKKLTEGKDYTVKYANNNAVTTSATKKRPLVTITGKGTYSGKIAKDYTITPKDFSDGILVLAADKPASSKPGQYKAKITLKDTNGKALKAGTDYDAKGIRYFQLKEDGTETLLTKQDNPAAGTRIRAEITAKGNYSGSVSSVYRIIEKKQDISKANIRIQNQEYTGKPIQITDISQFQTDKTGNPVCSLKDGASTKVLTFGASATEGVDFIVVPGSYENNIDKGTAKVTFQGTGEYGGYKTVTFTIGAKSIGTILKGIWNTVMDRIK